MIFFGAKRIKEKKEESSFRLIFSFSSLLMISLYSLTFFFYVQIIFSNSILSVGKR